MESRQVNALLATLDLIRQMTPDDVAPGDFLFALWCDIGEILIADHDYERISLVQALVEE